MKILSDIIGLLLVALLFITPGIICDVWLSKIGVVRSSKGAIVIGTIILVFVKPIILRDLSWWVYGICILLGVTLGVHRIDLRETIKHGRWWWKKTDLQ
jgi:hypothetical protein